ncbi:MAG: GIY-YIG nuclease family protein [Bacteroidia bacterium]
MYIMSNRHRTTIYNGVTSDLERRVYEHKNSLIKGFTEKDKLFDLVYYEEIFGMQNAIDREKQLKTWKREWKWDLIKSKNPRLVDLAKSWDLYCKIPDPPNESVQEVLNDKLGIAI